MDVNRHPPQVKAGLIFLACDIAVIAAVILLARSWLALILLAIVFALIQVAQGFVMAMLRDVRRSPPRSSWR